MARGESAAADLPQPVPEPAPVPAPRDVPFPGAIDLHLDATDVGRGIFRVDQRVPIPAPGPLILLYPKWLPGFHAPQAPIELFAGLTVRAGDRTLAWRRHPTSVNAFIIDVPAGTAMVEASFQFLSPTDPSQGRVLCTPDLLILPWNTVLLYPAGHYARQVTVAPTLRLPDGWRHGCILNAEKEGDTLRFRPVAVDVLVDSPLLAGRHLRRVALDDRVGLCMAADRPEQLDATPDQIASHRAVVEQADQLFGARRYDRFEMLLALSDELSAAGVEHHRCFEAVTTGDYFTNWAGAVTRRDTVPHEYLHSWNGKGRRGADSWQPCFERQIRNSLLWVYEGLTQYWTQVLAARAGLWTAELARGSLALIAARYEVRPGSRWRPTGDTTRDPQIAAREPLPWPSWQRSEDYYGEGALIWLDVDTRLRALSDGTRSLDDFARAFFGGAEGQWQTELYEFDDVVAALNGVAAFDWADFFHARLDRTHVHAPLDGLARGGYRLAFQDRPNPYQGALAAATGQLDLTYTFGFVGDDAGRLSDVLWGGPAFDAALTIGDRIVAVGAHRFTPEVIEQAARQPGPVTLTVAKGNRVREVRIEAADGLRYPHLVPVEDGPRRLDAILSPRQARAATA